MYANEVLKNVFLCALEGYVKKMEEMEYYDNLSNSVITYYPETETYNPFNNLLNVDNQKKTINLNFTYNNVDNETSNYQKINRVKFNKNVNTMSELKYEVKKFISKNNGYKIDFCGWVNNRRSFKITLKKGINKTKTLWCHPTW